MMSKKQWFVLLCVFMCYILFGATVFYTVESEEEDKRLLVELEEREEIEELLERNYLQSEEHTLNDMFVKISIYCDKPLGDNVNHTKTKLTWTFYHAIFFIMTIVSTIGYGNLSPTTPFTRTFMILYGLIGIPINGIVVITLGDFFGKSFLKLYRRWKTERVQHVLATVGLIGQITLYLILGMTLFVLIPSLIMMMYENWSFGEAVEFAFATLTTIGVGHNVPGTSQNEYGKFVFGLYRMFLLIWIIMGLGYLAMVFSFISRGLRSKQIQALEHKLSNNIKKTNRRIRRELRSVLNEYLLMRVKRVYRNKRYTPIKCGRTQSCPDLRTIAEDLKNKELPKVRKRAFSELTKPTPITLAKIQSEADLEHIDKERTFVPQTDMDNSNQLLLKVANALGEYGSSCTSSNPTLGQIQYDSQNNIDNDDHFDTEWSIGTRKISKLTVDPMRPRAASESKKEKGVNNFNSSFDYSQTRQQQELREKEKYGRTRSRTLPPIDETQNFFTRMKNTLKVQERKKSRNADVEGQNYKNEQAQNQDTRSPFSPTGKDQLLEETSLADFLRALTAINISDLSTPRRKYGTANSPDGPRRRRQAITPAVQSRKTSETIPCSPPQDSKLRRFSLSPTPSLNIRRKYSTTLLFPPISEVNDELSNRFSTRNRQPIHSITTHRPRFKAVTSPNLNGKTTNPAPYKINLD